MMPAQQLSHSWTSAPVFEEERSLVIIALLLLSPLLFFSAVFCSPVLINTSLGDIHVTAEVIDVL
jgi:hypothetical protein